MSAAPSRSIGSDKSTAAGAGPGRALVLYALGYVSTLALARRASTVVVSLALLLAVLLGTRMVLRWVGTGGRQAGGAGARAMRLTGAAEGVGLLAALVLAVGGAGRWSLPVLLSTVAVHVATTGASVRRPVDRWIVPWAAAAAAGLWWGAVASVPPERSWPLGGAVAAGVCLSYAMVLRSDAHGTPPAS